MDLLEKGLAKASKVIDDNADSPNSDKENSVGSSVKQFYGNKASENSEKKFFKSYTPTPRIKLPNQSIKSLRFRASVPLNDLSSRRSLNFAENRPKKSSVFDSPPPSNGRRELPPYKIGFPNAGRSKNRLIIFFYTYLNTISFIGLTCYLNAVLQALLGQSNFNSSLLNCGKFVEENSTNEDGKLLSKFIKIAQSRESGLQESVREALYGLRKCLKTCLPQFGDPGLMQDAHEFLIFFCDTFNTQLLKMEAYPKENATLKCPFNQTFQFQLTETKKCSQSQCRHESTKSKSDFVLRLDMPTETSPTVSIQSLVKKTMLDSTVEMRCSSCGQFEKHDNKDFFSHLPQILIVYLPRSEFVNEKISLKNRRRIDVNPVICLGDYVNSDVDVSKLTPLNTAYDALWPTDSERRKRMNQRALSSPQTTPEGTPKKKSKLAYDALSPTDSEGTKRMIQRALYSPQTTPEGTPEKKSKLSLSDKDIAEKDVNEMSEEEQLRFALQKSLCDTTAVDVEEEEAVRKAIEESMKGREESYSDDDEARNTIIEVKGETRAKGEYDYQLTSCINHIGGGKTAEIGHYIADVYHQGVKKWYRYNDERVSSTDLQAVLQKSTFDGCLFFYTHKNVLE